MAKRIVIMAGGTGGHVFPALAVARLMRAQGWQVSWMGTRQGMENRVVPANGISLDYLPVAGLRGKGMTAKIRAPFMLLHSAWQALKILRTRKPDVVLGMGGFVAGPGGLMARLLSIPLVIHEQNRIPGTTNRLLSWFANVVLEAFPSSFKTGRPALFTGNPLRSEFNQLTATGIDKGDAHVIHLLVLGGSLGAQALNETVPEALINFQGICVRHQTGKVMRDEVREKYRKLGVEAEVTDFIEDVIEAYRWADLVVCRAGAMTVSELAAVGKPAVLIPFPYAVDDHQSANAHYLADAGGAVIIDQKQLSTEVLTEKINTVLSNLDTMSVAARSCAKTDAASVVAGICAREAGCEDI